MAMKERKGKEWREGVGRGMEGRRKGGRGREKSRRRGGREERQGGGTFIISVLCNYHFPAFPKCDSAGPSVTGILCSQCIVCSTLLAFLQDFTALHCVHCDVPITKKEHMFWLVLANTD